MTQLTKARLYESTNDWSAAARPLTADDPGGTETPPLHCAGLANAEEQQGRRNRARWPNWAAYTEKIAAG
jgi:hypothetical protein